MGINDKSVEKLIEHGADIFDTETAKRTPLHVAAAHGTVKHVYYRVYLILYYWF